MVEGKVRLLLGYDENRGLHVESDVNGLVLIQSILQGCPTLIP